MGREPSRRARRIVASCNRPGPDDRRDRVGRDAPRSQETRNARREINDRRFDAHLARSAVEYDLHVIPKLRTHMLRRRGRKPAEAVCRRCRNPAAEGSQQIERETMIRHAQADRVLPAGHDVGTRGARA